MENRLPVEEYHTAKEYYDSPEDERMELIDGYFYGMASPGRLHQKILGLIFRKIGDYIDSKGGKCEVYPAPFSVQLNEEEDTVFEPDISVICDPGKLNDRGCLGAPDWIIEIVFPGNPGHDYITKLNKYMEGGVREYWIAGPEKESLTVYAGELATVTPEIYRFTDTVKAGIYGDLEIDFKEIQEKIREK